MKGIMAWPEAVFLIEDSSQDMPQFISASEQTATVWSDALQGHD